MNSYEITVILDENITRTIQLPSKYSFNQLHEIICILYNLNMNSKYKFILDEINLTIENTGTLNRDNIDSRIELIDKYFQTFSKINYVNSNWNFLITIKNISQNIKYPRLVSFSGKYNPSENIRNIQKYKEAIKIIEESSANKALLIEFESHKIQESILTYLKINYIRDGNNIIILKDEETLNNYL